MNNQKNPTRAAGRVFDLTFLARTLIFVIIIISQSATVIKIPKFSCQRQAKLEKNLKKGGTSIFTASGQKADIFQRNNLWGNFLRKKWSNVATN